MSITRYTIRTRRDKYGWFAEAIEAQCGSYVLYDDHAAEVARLTAENERLRSENDLVRGAMAADDERLRLAAERVGVIAGCDAPEEMADMIEHLRSAIRDAELAAKERSDEH